MSRRSLCLSLLISALGCSSSSKPPACDKSRCVAGDDCIDDGSSSGPSCQRVCTQQAGCPYGWYCNDGHPTSWCVRNTTAFPQRAGQWGTLCTPGEGESNNKACDIADGFACRGVSPADANSFCTTFDCVKDSDCPGGWWCERVDVAPNTTTASRSFAMTRRVCGPRQYCAPCQTDHECPLAADGTLQHCVQDAKGSHFCSPQCAATGGCALDATCATQWTVCMRAVCAVDADCPQRSGTAERCFAGACKLPCTTGDCPAANGVPQRCDATGSCEVATCKSDDDCAPANGTYQHCNAGACVPECGGDADCDMDQKCRPLSVCVPRAGVCVGDGSFCSPCRSDADCRNGYCLDAAYSTERFCSQAVQGGPCAADAGTAPGGCPARSSGANYKDVACTTASSDFAPANQCVGYVILGTATGIQQEGAGCWTINR